MIRVWESFACGMCERERNDEKEEAILGQTHKETKLTLARGEMNRKESQGWNFEEQRCWGWGWAKGEEFMKKMGMGHSGGERVQRLANQGEQGRGSWKHIL